MFFCGIIKQYLLKIQMPKHVIGIDLGGTKIHGVLLDERFQALKEEKVLTEAKKGFESVLQKMFDMVQSLRDEHTQAIGIGVAGPLDHTKGIVYHAPNLPGGNNIHVKKIFEDKFSIPTFIENDARCFTIAEFTVGAGKGTKNMVGITLGTGVGSGIIINGEIYRGRDNISEIGHTTIDLNGHECHCGNKGCLERYASGTAILERTMRHLHKRDIETTLCGGEAHACKIDFSARDIYRAALDGDPLATHIMQDTGRYFGIGVANIINTLNPDIIVLGGSAAKAFDVFKDKMYETIKQRAFAPANEIPVVHQKLDSPGPVGAGIVAEKG